MGGTVSIDRRTRADGAPRDATDTVDAARFFGEELPERFGAAADRLAPALAPLDIAPLLVECDGDRWQLALEDGRPVVAPGGDGRRLSLAPGQLDDLVADLATPMGWFSSGRLDADVRLELLLDWWMVLRAVLDGTTPYAPGDALAAELAEVDLTRTFRPDDPDEDMRAFLEQAGYLHIGGVFTEEEMARISAEMDDAAPRYERGRTDSWWASTADGTDRLVRMLQFEQRSPTASALLHDGRLERIGRLTGDGHSLGAPGSRTVEALTKPIDVVQGISDVPWHKDCSLGRHSYECCSLTVGISVTGADAESGQLRVVAGTHRALVWPAFVRPGTDLPAVDLPTRTGDVTVHASCTMHMSQPPVVRERRVLYTSFGLPAVDPEATKAARTRFRDVRDAAPRTVSQHNGDAMASRDPIGTHAAR
jgi:hypothetical protein